jgi:hypothetical protein
MIFFMGSLLRVTRENAAAGAIIPALAAAATAFFAALVCQGPQLDV